MTKVSLSSEYVCVTSQFIAYRIISQMLNDRTVSKLEQTCIGLPHQRLWTIDVLVCPLSVTERFLLQPLVCGTVFHHTSLLHPLSPSAAVVFITSLLTFLSLSDSYLYSARAVTRHFGHYTRFYIITFDILS